MIFLLFTKDKNIKQKFHQAPWTLMDKACILDLDVLALEFFMVVSPSHSSISSVKTLVSLTRCSSKEALAQDPCCNITIFDLSGLYPKTHRHFKVVTDDSYWVVDLIARHENLLKRLLQQKTFSLKKKKKKGISTLFTQLQHRSLYLPEFSTHT
jgi:hypothetical protein